MPEEILNSVDAEHAPNVEVQAVEPEHVEPDTSVTPEAAEPERAKQTPEENAAFAKVRREAEERARVKAEDDVIARLYGESHGIKTMAEYNAAIEAQKEAERIAELEERGIDPEFINKLIDSSPDVVEARQIKEKHKKEQADIANRTEFLNHFKKEYGREFDFDKDEIPMEAWEMTLKGMPLKDAFEIAQAKILRAELAAVKSGQAAQEVNEKNARRSPGAIGTDGVTESNYISPETFDLHKSDRSWLVKNFTKIAASRREWTK